MDNIYELAGEMTIIATHRVATLKNCDKNYTILTTEKQKK